MPGRGPAPKPNAQRRNGKPVAHRELPLGGCDLPVPTWPFDCDEAPAWRSLWETPQAAAWHLGYAWPPMVARLAMLLERAEQPDARASLLSEVRLLEDSLGLSPRGMQSLRWAIVTDEEPEPARLTSIDKYRKPSKD